MEGHQAVDPEDLTVDQRLAKVAATQPRERFDVPHPKVTPKSGVAKNFSEYEAQQSDMAARVNAVFNDRRQT